MTHPEIALEDAERFAVAALSLLDDLPAHSPHRDALVAIVADADADVLRCQRAVRRDEWCAV